MGFRDRLSHAWNAFTDSNKTRDTEQVSYGASVGSFGLRPGRTRMSVTNERSMALEEASRGKDRQRRRLSGCYGGLQAQ